MQLRRAIALMAIALWPATSFAEPLARVDSRSSMYQDTDRTNIVTSNVAARGAPTEHLGVEARRYLADYPKGFAVDEAKALVLR